MHSFSEKKYFPNTKIIVKVLTPAYEMVLDTKGILSQVLFYLCATSHLNMSLEVHEMS
jgi:hypothetical protein